MLGASRAELAKQIAMRAIDRFFIVAGLEIGQQPRQQGADDASPPFGLFPRTAAQLVPQPLQQCRSGTGVKGHHAACRMGFAASGQVDESGAFPQVEQHTVALHVVEQYPQCDRGQMTSPATHGHIAALRRIRVGPFEESDAISLETLESLGHSAAAFEHLLPVGAALDDIPALNLTESEANRVRCGQAVSLLARADRERIQHLSQGAVVCAMAADTPVALARYEAGEIRPIRVLNL